MELRVLPDGWVALACYFTFMKVLIADDERGRRDQQLPRNGDETMSKGRGCGYWKQSIEKLKEKWTAFTSGIIRTIIEEEMKISREEFDEQIRTRARWPTHFKSGQLRMETGKSRHE